MTTNLEIKKRLRQANGSIRAKINLTSLWKTHLNSGGNTSRMGSNRERLSFTKNRATENKKGIFQVGYREENKIHQRLRQTWPNPSHSQHQRKHDLSPDCHKRTTSTGLTHSLSIRKPRSTYLFDNVQFVIA